jgi:hypothetical protein
MKQPPSEFVLQVSASSSDIRKGVSPAASTEVKVKINEAAKESLKAEST